MNTKNILLYHVISSINHSYPVIQTYPNYTITKFLVNCSLSRFLGGPPRMIPNPMGFTSCCFPLPSEHQFFWPRSLLDKAHISSESHRSKPPFGGFPSGPPRLIFGSCYPSPALAVHRPTLPKIGQT